jgi:RES domain-containing protein
VEPPVKGVRWPEAWRVIPTRYPPIQLFERVGDPADWEALAEIESLTNPRIRDELGDIRLVPAEDRVGGPGASWVMGPFVHRRPSRFSDGGHGVYYCAQSLGTAVHEVAFQLARFHAATGEDPLELALRSLCGSVRGSFHDLRGDPRWRPLLLPDDWRPAQSFAARLRARGSNGIVYPSTQDPDGTCLGAFRPRAVKPPADRGVLTLHWNGREMDRWFDHATGEWSVLTRRS